MKFLRSLGVAALITVGGMLAFSTPSFSDPPPLRVVNPRADVEQLLMKGDFDELESIAADYRSSQARMAGGFWALERFYDWTTTYSEPDCRCNAAGGGGKYTFEEKRRALELWLKSKSGSLTATIALAHLWQRYAWTGRGADSAGKTSDDQWRAFYERTERALELLRSLDAKADPEIYLMEMAATPIEDRPRRWLDDLYAAATQAFPNFPDYAATRSEFLRPVWYGETGEAVAFAQSLWNAPGDEGHVAYFGVARNFLRSSHDFASFYAGSGTTYMDLIKSFALRKRLFGDSNNDLNALMFFAIAARDKKSAAAIAEKIGDNWSPEIWISEQNFENAKTWTSSWP